MSRSFRRDRGPCEAVVDGRVLVYPFGNFSGPQDIPPMLLNDVRQELLQDVLAASGRLDAPMVCGAPHLVPYCMADGGRTCLYLVNGALDAVENIVLHVGGGARTVRVAALPSDDREVHFATQVRAGMCKLPLAVAPMESVMLILEETTERMEEQ